MNSDKVADGLKILMSLHQAIARQGIGINVNNMRDSLAAGLDCITEGIQGGNSNGRHIVQIAGDGNRIYALCIDGSIWQTGDRQEWFRIIPIPTDDEMKAAQL